MPQRTSFFLIPVVIVIGLLMVLARGASAQEAGPASASADIYDVQGRLVGRASLTTLESGAVRVQLSVSGYNPVAGAHGVHIHQFGRCESPDFMSAGSHFNPTGAKHGFDNPEGPHAGDLPTMHFNGDGSGSYDATSDLFTLIPGPTSIFDADGASIVIHSDPDDYMTDPAGNSGDRIGCGIIVPSQAVGPAPTPTTPPGTPAPPAPPPPTRVGTVVGSIDTPQQLPFSEERMQQLQLPDGFRVNVFAQNMGNARMMATGPDGTIYLTRRMEGDVLALKDTDGDGRSDEVHTVASDLKLVHGITIHENHLYLATDTHVFVSDLQADGMISTPRAIISDLPGGGQHPNRTLRFGPDGMLYITVGSTCNACDEPDDESATILRANPDGSERVVYASGLRNTIGFGWHPWTGEWWGMDHGSDWRGDNQPPEELNRIQMGGVYGWPFCFGERNVDIYLPAEPEGTTKESYCATTLPPVLTYQAHSAPIDMLFYMHSQFPSSYQGDAFVAMRGSWNRTPPTGYKVVRIHFENGQPVGFEDFLTGFLLDGGGSHFARIAGLTIMQDGSLLVSDDTNGVIYRLSYGE